ncbi:unnamed protein product [Peniophora sp. CBMAI 1063]|nr:unnamed protein product [Peniophora sp. CBMAI 1063]
MSSADEDHAEHAGPSAPKRPRRNNHACEMCRKRKARCDGKQPGTDKCTNCSIYNRECTFTVMSRKYPSGYVEALETKLRKYEGLVQRILPGQDFTQEVGFKLTIDNWMLPGACGAPEPQNQSMFLAEPGPPGGVAPGTSLSVMSAGSAPPTPMPDDEHSSDDDTRARAMKLLSLRKFNVPRPCLLPSYLGKSSATELFVKAFEMRNQLGHDLPRRDMPRSRPWWLTFFGTVQELDPLRFPDQDLMDELIEHYFTNINIFTPVLHRPTFDEDLRTFLHLRERNFGCVVLLVCALGSRFSSDPRVLVEGDQTWYSAGWKWFIQTRIFDDANLLSTTWHLHVLQAACLATAYASDVSSIHAWMLVGAGIRFAVDIGAHKQRAYGAKPALEDELYKRSFWTLVYFDRTLSANMGRPCSIQEEDFDLQMPLCCDDDYFTGHDAAPVGEQPSVLNYFIWSLKLSQIQGLALRTVYASTKTRVHYGFQGEEWMARTVAHLDSLLNNWTDSLPDHLRWDSARSDDVFFSQSAHLQMQYRMVQIMIHRPFIAARGVKPLPALPLLMCSNAARAMARLAEALQKRTPHRLGGMDLFMWTLGTAAMVLLISIGNARLSNVKIDRKRTMADIEVLFSILRERKERWPSAVRLLGLLDYFMFLGGNAEEDQPAQRKRPHDADSHVDSEQTSNVASGSFVVPPVNDPLSGIDWSEIVGNNQTRSSMAGNIDFALDEPFPQGTGAVFGNVDFGALFGLGEPGLENGRPWSPAPPEESLDTLLGRPVSGTGESMNFGLDTWPLSDFNSGADEWQWMAPTEQGAAGPSGFGGATERTSHS